jgi:hypothetical protein
MLRMERRGESMIDRSWEDGHDYNEIEISKGLRIRGNVY